jgi:hypothetical protein
VPIGVLGTDDEIVLSRNANGFNAERRPKSPSAAIR